MSGAQHTPGPWAVITDADSSLQISVDGDDEENGHVVTEWLVVESTEYAGFAAAVIGLNSPNCYDDDLLAANARLIAAAPPLLDRAVESSSLLMRAAVALREAGQEDLALDLEAHVFRNDETIALARGEAA